MLTLPFLCRVLEATKINLVEEGVGNMCYHSMRYGPRVDYDHSIGLLGPEYHREKCQRASLKSYYHLDIERGEGYPFYSK